jgi:hypothetical protein
MKRTFLAYCFLFFWAGLYGQTTIKSVNKKPVKDITLKLQSSEGTNGCALAWNPSTSCYYSVIAGNSDFPIDVFSADGRQIQSIAARMDLRGFWHNPTYGMMEGNTYENMDIATYLYLTDGTIDEADEPLIELYELPITSSQAALSLNFKENKYIWFDYENNKIKQINPETGAEDGELTLNLPVAKENLNSTTVGYTGVEGAEYALLNFQEKVVYLINASTGSPTLTLKLPKDAVTHEMFRFSYANDHIWLYDIESRTWTGYATLKVKK